MWTMRNPYSIQRSIKEVLNGIILTFWPSCASKDLSTDPSFKSLGPPNENPCFRGIFISNLIFIEINNFIDDKIIMFKIKTLYFKLHTWFLLFQQIPSCSTVTFLLHFLIVFLRLYVALFNLKNYKSYFWSAQLKSF